MPSIKKSTNNFKLDIFISNAFFAVKMRSTFYMFKHIFKMYSWAGKELPFILLAVLALFDGALQFVVLGEFFLTLSISEKPTK